MHSMRLRTTQGPLASDQLGSILAHEHVVADLRPLGERESSLAHPIDAIRTLIEPEVRAALAVGVTAIVEATPVGVGRRADAIEAISKVTGMPFALATGIYREPWVPDWVRRSSSARLTDWMLGELQDRVAGTDTPAAWIKLSAGDGGMTAEEERILRAAARAAVETGCAIGSHTTLAEVVEAQLDILEDENVPADRFVWIHAQVEPDAAHRRELADRGCWIELDWIGRWPTDEEYAVLISDLIEADLTDRILLSQDCGWYDPANPDGGLACGPYTGMHERFLPLLRERGFDEEILVQLTVDNPFRAFSRP